MCSGFPGSCLFLWHIAQMLDWRESRGIWRSSHNDKFFVVPLKAFLNHFATRQGALFCWNRPQPPGNAATLKGWTRSASASRLVRGYSSRASLPTCIDEPYPPHETFDIGNSYVLEPLLTVTTAEQGHPTKAAGLTRPSHPAITIWPLSRTPQALTLAHFLPLPTHQHWGPVCFLGLSNPRNHNEETPGVIYCTCQPSYCYAWSTSVWHGTFRWGVLTVYRPAGLSAEHFSLRPNL